MNFLAQERPYFHLRKVQNKNFSVISKHGIPCYRKYNLIVFWELKNHLFRFLKYYTIFVNTKERSLYQLPTLKKIPFTPRNPFFPQKFIWTFPFVQSSCFCNNFFFSFIETYVSFNHFKDLLNLHYKMKYEAKLRNFFSLNFQWLQHDIWQFWWHQRSLETESGTSILQKPKQRRQYFNWNSYQPWSNTPYKK